MALLPDSKNFAFLNYIGIYVTITMHSRGVQKWMGKFKLSKSVEDRSKNCHKYVTADLDPRWGD